MFERRIRLIVTGTMFVTLFLPAIPPPDSEPNWIYILWYSMEALPRVFRSTDIAYCVGWLLPLLGLLSIPFLIPFNLCLAIRSFKEVKILYRIFVLALPALAWYTTFLTDPELRGVGLWANALILSIAMLLEAALVAKELLDTRKRGISTQ